MADRMPIDHDIDLLCYAAEWAAWHPASPIGLTTVQRRVRVGFVKAQRLLLLMAEYGITGPPVGSPPRQPVLTTREELAGKLAELRDIAGREAGDG